jgi:hypothetical protein
MLAVPMRRVGEVEAEVLSRPGRYRKVADNLEVKEVWVGTGERRRDSRRRFGRDRHSLCVEI